MSEIIAGNPSPIEQGYGFTIRKTGGGVEVVRAWAGTPSAIRSQAISLYNDPLVTEVDARHEPGSAIAVVRAKFATLPDVDEPVQESVAIRWTDAAQELHRHPRFVGITTNRIEAIEEEVSKRSAGTPPTDATELEYYNIRRRGVSTYRAKIPIVTYTRMAPRQTDEVLNVSGSGKIVPLASIPVESFFDMSGINLNLGFDPANADTYTPGWLLSADGDVLSNGNAQLIEAYEYGLWENQLYIFV